MKVMVERNSYMVEGSIAIDSHKQGSAADDFEEQQALFSFPESMYDG